MSDNTREVLGRHSLTGDRSVTVVKGDIVAEAVGAIACPATETLEYSEGIAWDVLDQGGNIIRDETDMIIAQSGGQIQSGECVASSSGRLPCKRIIHCVVPQWRGGGTEQAALRSAILNCLKLADKFKAPVVAIPPLGAVTRGYPRTLSADVIWKAICEFFQQNPSSYISSIVLIAKGRNTALCFQKTVENNPIAAPPPVQSHVTYARHWATDNLSGDSNLVIHLVAPGSWSQKGCMGRITNKFGPEAAQAFDESDHWPGEVIITKVAAGVFSAAVVALKKGDTPSLDMASLQKGLTFVYKNALKYNSNIHFHRPSNKAVQGLSWPVVHNLLCDSFGGSRPVSVLVCSSESTDFDMYPNAPPSKLRSRSPSPSKKSPKKASPQKKEKRTHSDPTLDGTLKKKKPDQE